MSIKIGCSGFGMNQQLYMGKFSTVEVQQTFYQPPQRKTLTRWRENAPNQFEFVIKAWQIITHESRSSTYRRLKRTLSEAEAKDCGSFKLTPIVKEAWQTTLDCADALSATRILLQCPGSFLPTPHNLDNMRGFFEWINREARPIVYWEPRGSWDVDLIRELCLELGCFHAIDPFISTSATPDHLYFRLHGINGWRHIYDNKELATLQQMVEPQSKVDTSFVFFNNIKMNDDAHRFEALLKGC